MWLEHGGKNNDLWLTQSTNCHVSLWKYAIYSLFSYTLSSALRFALTRGYATENRPQADVLEVNQSPEMRNINRIIATTITDSSVSSNVTSLYLSLLPSNLRENYTKMIGKEL